MRQRGLLLPAVISVCLVAASGEECAASVVTLGSTFSVVAVNSPDTFTEAVTLTQGNHLLDSGKVNLNIKLVPDPGLGGEWLVFNYTTTDGDPLVSLRSAFWQMVQQGIELSEPAKAIEFYMQFTIDGVAQAATSFNIFGPGSVGANPIPGEVGIGDIVTGVGLGFVNPSLPAGPMPQWGAGLGPFNQLDRVGIVSANVNGWENAMLFMPIPEPTSFVLLCTGLAALAARRRRSITISPLSR